MAPDAGRRLRRSPRRPSTGRETLVALTREAEALDDRAEAVLAEIPPWAPESDKLEGWSIQTRARELRQRAQAEDLAIDQGLHAALRLDPNLPDAHAALAERHRTAHAAAEVARDAEAVARHEAGVRTHAESSCHKRIHTGGNAFAICVATGALTLHTEPAGAAVKLFRFVEENRRLVPRFERDMGSTPIVAEPLAMGSYLCELTHDGPRPRAIPGAHRPRQHWHDARPGSDEPTPIHLPRGRARSGRTTCTCLRGPSSREATPTRPTASLARWCGAMPS